MKKHKIPIPALLVFCFIIAGCSSNSPSSDSGEVFNPTIIQEDEKHLFNDDKELKQFGYETYAIDALAERGYFGAGVKICIVDTGVDLKSKEISVKESESFVDGSAQDENSHGTQIAGIIAANTQNNVGLVGLAPKSDLYIAKVTNKNGYVKSKDVIPAINWCAEKKVDLINISLGFDTENLQLSESINTAAENGIAILAAAGNRRSEDRKDDFLQFPAKLDSVLSVAQLDTQGNIADSSILDDRINLHAPGVNIIGTYLNNKLNYATGSSFATAYATGIAALFLGQAKHEGRIESKEDLVIDINYVFDFDNDPMHSIFAWGVLFVKFSLIVAAAMALLIVVKNALKKRKKRN